MRVLQYPVVIEKAARNYSAFCPDLPGCIATGQTIEETITNMQKAIRLHLQGLQEDGLPIPKPSKELRYQVNSQEVLTGIKVSA